MNAKTLEVKEISINKDKYEPGEFTLPWIDSDPVIGNRFDCKVNEIIVIRNDHKTQKRTVSISAEDKSFSMKKEIKNYVIPAGKSAIFGFLQISISSETVDLPHFIKIETGKDMELAVIRFTN